MNAFSRFHRSPGAIWVKRARGPIRIGTRLKFPRRFPPLAYQLAALRGGRPDCAYPYTSPSARGAP